MAINNRIFGTPITGSVKTELIRRQSENEEFKFGESINLKKNIELSSRTPFIRMWTAVKLIEPEKVVTKLIDGVAEEITEPQINEEQKNLETLMSNYGKSYDVSNININYYSTPVDNTYVNIPLSEATEFANSVSKKFLKFNKKPKSVDEVVREQIDHEEKIYIVGNYEYNTNYRQISPNDSSFFPNEGEQNPLLKPQTGITSITSETLGVLGERKQTTINFVVHNFYDFDKIYNKYFLKPGAKIFVDFGWNTVENLYNPKTLLEKANEEKLNDYLYGNTEDGDSDNGLITKNNGNLEIIQGIVSDYNAKILQNGSIECSLTLTSANAALLSNVNDDKIQIRIKQMLESGIFYLGLKQIINNLPVDSQERKDLSEDFIPNFSTEVKTIETFEKNLIKNANRTLGFVDGEEKVTDLSVIMGLFLTDANFSDAYMSWGRFEDYIINETFGHGKNLKDINKGNKSQIRMDSTNSYSMWSNRFSQRQRTIFRLGKDVPNFIFPPWWGNNNPNGTGNSYSYQVGKSPKQFVSTKNDKGNEEFGRIPLREVFINIDLINKTFEKFKNKPISKIIKEILKNINDDSDNLFNWSLTTGDKEHELKVVDLNYIDADKLKSNLNDEGTDNLFTFNIMSPTSVVKDYNLEFKLPSNSIGDMYAIKGMSVIDKISKDDSRIQNLVDIESIDFDNLKTIYLPDDGSYRAKDKFSGGINAETYKVYTRINDLLSTDTLNIAANLSSTFDFIEGEGNMLKDDNADETNNKENDVKIKQRVDLNKISDEELIVNGFIVTNSVEDYYRSKSSDSIKKKNIGLLPYNLSLSIYGIGSIVPGDTFKVDYLPKEHLKNTFLQVMKVSHDVDSSGWATNLETVYRPLYPDNKTSIYHDIPTNKGKVRLSSAVVVKEFGLMTTNSRVAPDTDPRGFNTYKQSGDRDKLIDWNEFFKYVTDVVIEDQSEDSKIDHILHFKTRGSISNIYFKNLKVQDNRIQNHTADFLAGFRNATKDLATQFKVRDVGIDETSELDDTKIDLVKKRVQNSTNYYYPPNVKIKGMTEYRLFIRNNTAVILDPRVDEEGNVSDQYKKLKSFYQTYAGFLTQTFKKINLDD